MWSRRCSRVQVANALSGALLTAAMLLSACGGGGSSGPPATPTPSPPPTESPRDRYEPGPCKFETPPGERVECGFLTVPEDRSDPSGGTIRLHVAVFKSHNQTPDPDPLVYFSGGPGGSILENLSTVDHFSAALVERDLVLFDQRGVGFSEPALDCQEVTDAAANALRDATSAEVSGERLAAAYAACAQRLRAQGIALDAYNSKQSAADVDDLRQALGYEKWNVLGVSYGTKLALTYMRDFPEGVRSAVLDSTYPLQVDIFAELVPNARRAFDVLFAGCAAHPDCGASYPNLEQALFNVVERLDQQPATATVLDPFTGETIFQATITGDEVLGAIFAAMYSSQFIPYLPRVIALAEQGDYEPIGLILYTPVDLLEQVSSGMYTSVQCHEELVFSSPEVWSANAETYPELRDFVAGDRPFDVCAAWGAGQAGAPENEPVRGDIPTLILAGEYDPITPPDWGRRVSQDLSRSFYFEFPGIGHGAIFSHRCPAGMTQEYLRNPTRAPDSSCIAEMGPPDFSDF